MLIKGDLAVDDRGACWFVNDFHFDNVKRFYVLSNHKMGYVRAWHGHRVEEKYVYVAKGTAVIGVAKIDHWEHPSQYAETQRFVLSDKKPQVLHIPAMYANGSMVLETGTLIFHFSTTLLGEIPNDDQRFPADFFNDATTGKPFQWKAIER